MAGARVVVEFDRGPMSKALGRVLPRRRATPGAAWSRLGHIGSAPELRPLSLAGTGSGTVFTAACLAAIVTVMGLEMSTPTSASIGSLIFIPVVAASWFLGAPQALIVFAVAAVARLVSYTTAGLDVGTVVAELVTLAALGITTRAAAVGLVEARERRARAARDKQALELLAQRDRIASNVTNTAIKRLFAVTLNLDAVAARANDPSLKPTLDQAIAEVDALTAEFRTLVFGDLDGPPAEAGARRSSILLK